jgi:4-carboxymuconolactone decarboxylase
VTDKQRVAIDLVRDSDHPDARATFEKLAGGSVGVVNIHRTIANSPTVFSRFIGFAHALRFETELDPAERELAILRVLERCDGHYEIVHHRRMGAAAGLSEAELAHVGDPGAPHAIYTERQRAILDFADRFAAGAGVEPEAGAALSRHLDSRQRVELGLTLALYLGLAHFTNSIDVPVD